MKKFIQKGLVIAAGLVTVPAIVSHADHKLPKPECKSTDHRFLALSRFFREKRSPIVHLSSAFIQEADANHLDWRLLPGLMFIESGGGRNYYGNNIFGWNNGGRSFRSVREAIHVVAERLAHSRHYRGKTLAQKLSVYNPNEGYGESVQAVMTRISRSR